MWLRRPFPCSGSVAGTSSPPIRHPCRPTRACAKAWSAPWYLILFVTLLALPFGIAAAIYLQEYARDTRINRILVTNVRNLAGVPSIVYGVLGLVIFAQAFRGVTGPGKGNPASATSRVD